MAQFGFILCLFELIWCLFEKYTSPNFRIRKFSEIKDPAGASHQRSPFQNLPPFIFAIVSKMGDTPIFVILGMFFQDFANFGRKSKWFVCSIRTTVVRSYWKFVMKIMSYGRKVNFRRGRKFECQF